MTADISMAGTTNVAALIAPDTNLGTSSYDGTKFSGHFNGNGHTISKFTIDTDSQSYYYLGLFGYVLGGDCSIQNLTLANAVVKGNWSSCFVGTLCGYIRYANITNCCVSGEVRADNYVGGMCGWVESCCVYGCSADVAVYGDDRLGGLIGEATTSTTTENSHAYGDVYGENETGGLCGRAYSAITRCYASGQITTGYEMDNVGGLCGDSDAVISRCCAFSSVLVGTSCDYVGGLCGNSEDFVDNCYTTGRIISGAGTRYVGGLNGRMTASISNCYSTVFVATSNALPAGALFGRGFSFQGSNYFYPFAAPDYSHSTPLSLIQLQSASSFAGFDFAGSSADGTDDVWAISAGHCPRLSWESGSGPLPPVGYEPETTLSGSGTAVAPYVIDSVSDFLEFSSNADLNRGYYELTSDIDLSGNPFSRAAVDRQFGVFFEGNGYSIRNMNIVVGGDIDNVGLFGYFSGTVENLQLESASVNAFVSGSPENCGSLCGYSLNGIIRNCRSEDLYLYGNQYAGGLVGYMRNGELSECFVSGSVRGHSQVGGLRV